MPVWHLKEENDIRSAIETAITATRPLLLLLLLLLLVTLLLLLVRGHHDRLQSQGSVPVTREMKLTCKRAANMAGLRVQVVFMKGCRV